MQRSTDAEQQAVVCWFKTTDLRLDDHAPLIASHRAGVAVVHLLVLDPVWWGGAKSLSGGARLPRVGLRRARFMHQSVAALRLSLQQHGHELLVFHGKAEEAFQRLSVPAGKFKIVAVHTHADICVEEVGMEARVRASLAALPGSPTLKLHWGWTLHHVDDLPAAMQRGNRTPERYKQFLQAVQRGKRSASARKPMDEPTTWAPVPNTLPRDWVLPPEEELLTPGVFEADTLAAPSSRDSDTDEIGGEQAAVQAMQQYIWDQDRLKNYVGSSDSMSPGKFNALNSTTRLSTYLAHGCLSPRRLYAEVLRYEKHRMKNRSTYWVFHELVFRDFFAFSCIKWGPTMFSAAGPLHSPAATTWRPADEETKYLFSLWREGRTGYPFVDAGMRQLRSEGRMPHLLRQVCAGFLVRDLRIDWRWGAEWFERTLSDYTPDANWGNWGYRILPVQQLMPLCETHLTSLEILSWPWVHDPHLEYILTWLPELRSVAKAFDLDRRNVLEPWRLASDYQRKQEIDVTPARDSPLWIMSVNRVNWPDYQKMMTGRAHTVTYTPHSPLCIHKELCQYPAPVVPPIELEILPDKIPVDHSWGVPSERGNNSRYDHQRGSAGQVEVLGSDAQSKMKSNLREASYKGAARVKAYKSSVPNSKDVNQHGRTPRQTEFATAGTFALPNPHLAATQTLRHDQTRRKTSTRERKRKPRRGGGRVQSGPLNNQPVEQSASRQTHLREGDKTSDSSGSRTYR